MARRAAEEGIGAKKIAGLARIAGRTGCGDNLWFTRDGSPLKAKWMIRYTPPTTRRVREMHIGIYPEIGLAKAREAAHGAMVAVRAGRDPLDERRATIKAAISTGLSLQAAAKACP